MRQSEWYLFYSEAMETDAADILISCDIRSNIPRKLHHSRTTSFITNFLESIIWHPIYVMIDLGHRQRFWTGRIMQLLRASICENVLIYKVLHFPFVIV